MSKTPRTDEIEKLETYEEWEVTHNYKSLCEELELELSNSVVLEIRDWTPERWALVSTIAKPAALWISGEQMDRLMKLELELAEAKDYME